VAARKFADTETWLIKVEDALCKLYRSAASALQNNIPRHTARVALLGSRKQQQWINGHGKLQK